MPDAGVRVEAEKRFVFFRQAEHELSQQRVFEDVREMTRVKEMSVGEHGLSR